MLLLLSELSAAYEKHPKPLHHPLTARTTTAKWDEGHICLSVLV